MLRRVMMAGASAPPPTSSTFDPALKGADITLSNGNMDATKVASGYQTAYTTLGRNAGVYAFEMLMTSQASISTALIGIADKTNSAAVIGTYLGNNSGPVETLGYNDNNGSSTSGRAFRRMTVGNTAGGTARLYTEGDVVTIKVDFGNNQVTAYCNGTIFNGVMPISVTPGKTYYPAASMQSGTVVRFRPVGLSYLPSGATEWG